VAEAEAAAAIHLDAAYCADLLPRRNPVGHKGTFGTVVCVAGSLNYAGAALLAATSAARGGAGLVTLAVPASLQPLFAARVVEATTYGLAEKGTDIDPAAAGHALKSLEPSALVVGPGLAETEGYRDLVVGLVARPGPPMVVDGGALTLLSGSGEWWNPVGRDLVLTPHPGEFARLTGSMVAADDDIRRERASEAARRFAQVVVLKGARTVVAAPNGRIAVAPFANAALATAGSGDVLAGLIGALLAQGLTPFDAACLGVFLHGQAGERISARLGDAGLLASDLPLEIALARAELARAHA
jgi:ADP-dependent NAD(P)H-hydrate dehydratase / NAD(P)H-hydrate epimerase